jgi:YHS domain-containing protein
MTRLLTPWLLLAVILATAWNRGLGCGHICGSPNAGPVLGGVDFVQMKYYFTNGLKPPKLPVDGNMNYTATVGNYQFWFQSQENQAKFTSKPEEYYPQFGGYCAWALTGYDPNVVDESG